jgi:transcriptional regulator with XRE-family HTH domain
MRLDTSIVLPLMSKARRTIGLTQKQLAAALEASLRTVSRWETQGTSLVHPLDASLAGELARESGTTLEELGLVKPPPALAPGAPPQPPPAPPLPAYLVVDAVVFAAAAALEATPGTLRGMRSAVLAAFRRAGELRLSVADVETALAVPVALKEDEQRGSPRRTRVTEPDTPPRRPPPSRR